MFTNLTDRLTNVLDTVDPERLVVFAGKCLAIAGPAMLLAALLLG